MNEENNVTKQGDWPGIRLMNWCQKLVKRQAEEQLKHSKDKRFKDVH